VPNFVNGQQQPGQGRIQGKEGGKPNSKSSNSRHSKGNNPSSALSPPPSRSTPNLQNLAQLPGAAPPFWWHSRLYPDSGIGASSPSTASGQSGYPPPLAFHRVNEMPATIILDVWVTEAMEHPLSLNRPPCSSLNSLKPSSLQGPPPCILTDLPYFEMVGNKKICGSQFLKATSFFGSLAHYR